MLPVKNYCEELGLDVEIDTLLLTAVEQMLNYADNYFENQITDNQDNQPEMYRSGDQFQHCINSNEWAFGADYVLCRGILQ